MRVYPVLLVLFLAVPLVEIYLLIKIGGVIGAWPTVALVVGTAVAGAGLLRWQGMATLLRVRQSLERGELPALPMLEGVLLLIAGALLGVSRHDHRRRAVADARFFYRRGGFSAVGSAPAAPAGGRPHQGRRAACGRWTPRWCRPAGQGRSPHSGRRVLARRRQ